MRYAPHPLRIRRDDIARCEDILCALTLLGSRRRLHLNVGVLSAGIIVVIVFVVVDGWKDCDAHCESQESTSFDECR